MKLYFTPGFCSLAPHIVLRELDLPFTLDRVSNRTKLTVHGDDYRAINPLGYVPALELADGTVLHEVAAILAYLGDQRPDAQLIPPHGSDARYQLHATLNFIASELHKPFSYLLDPRMPEPMKAHLRDRLGNCLAYLAPRLVDGGHLAGPAYTVADPYLFTVLGWSTFAHLDLTPWPVFASYRARVAARPAVVAALAAESART